MMETPTHQPSKNIAREDNHKRIARIASYQCRRLLVAPVSGELHQKDKEVEEIKVKRKRAHDRLLAGNRGAVVVQINLLNALRVVGGISPTNTMTPTTEIASCTIEDARNTFTMLAMMMPTNPINRNEAVRARSARVV